MARKKMRRYDGGGEVEAEEIVVQGSRPKAFNEISAFDLGRMGGGGYGAANFGGDMGGMGGGAGGGMPTSQRLPNLSYVAPKAERPPIMPAIVRGATSELANLMGQKAPRGYGASFKTDFKKGGKVKKMASGGSASKRADGIATKGKTKGRFV